MQNSAAGPLSGLTVGRLGDGVVVDTAAWLLAGLGAAVAGPPHDFAVASSTGNLDGPGAGVAAARAPYPAAGVPAGTVPYTVGVALATAALAGFRTRARLGVSELAVAVQVFLPEVMAAAYRSPTAMRSPDPVPAPGGGWLNADLGSPGDRERFADLLAVLPPGADAAAVAAAAQEWRLPVCEYRRRRPAERRFPIALSPGPPSEPRIATARVCDLTTMWAGPLATWLLRRLGATVHKVEPDARLDGTRAIRGGGIYPDGRQLDPGRDSAMWNALNDGKVRVPLDLGVAAQRDEFVALARGCDVVIDSFSPRVMPNFGLPPLAPAGRPGPVLASVPAFGPGPERDWVAYGTGIHAFLGLGETRDGTFAPPLVSYPDPVAGFTAALAVVAALVGRDRGRPAARVEVPLAAATQPLLALAGAFEPAGDDRPSPGPALLAGARSEGLLAPRQVAGLTLMHPVGPFLDAEGSPLDQNVF